MRAAAALLAALLAAAPAGAGEGASAWSSDHASRARLLAGEAGPGARWAGVEIEMDAGHKTYWRTPGETGVPPELDWSGSTNVAAVEVVFPAPERFEDPFGAYFGYLEHVVLPVRVTPLDPSAPARLSLEMLYGVCKEICIPATASLALDLPAAGAEGDPAVAAALARAPVPAALGETREGLAVLGVEPGGEGRLSVRVRAPQDAILLVEGPRPTWLLAPAARMAPAAAPGEGVFDVEIAYVPPGERAAEAALRLTLVAGPRAIETTATAPVAP